MPEVNEAIVMPLLGKITELNDRYSTASDSYLYSGMSVLARDMYSYLSLHPQSNAKFFLDMIPSVIEEEKKERYDAGFWHDNKLPFPYDDSAIAVINLPKGIVEPAAEGKIDISALYNDSIIHEWTSFTGRILFRKFKSRFKEVICSKEGPYEKFIKGQVSVAGLPSAMVLNVYANGVSNETFLVPILLFFSVLLIKEGIEKYCKVQVI